MNTTTRRQVDPDKRWASAYKRRREVQESIGFHTMHNLRYRGDGLWTFAGHRAHLEKLLRRAQRLDRIMAVCERRYREGQS